MQLWQETWDLIKGDLLLWGEKTSSTDAAAEVAGVPNQPPAHPFCCSAEEIEAGLQLMEFIPASRREIEVLLPSCHVGPDDRCEPLPSPRLMSDSDIDREADCRLQGWLIPAVALDPLEALSFLTSISDQPAPGVRFDQSLVFWRECTKLLLELLTKGRFLPGLLRREVNWHSHWHILPKAENDHRRLSVLAESMPPLCRAVASKGQAVALQPNVLLESFLSVTADSLIRAFLARHSVTSTLDRGKIPPRLSLQYQWLESLTSKDAQLSGPEYELIKLEQRLRGWAGGLVKSARSQSVILGFRLHAPREKHSFADVDPDSWAVSFFLRDADDATKELPAVQLFAGTLGFLQTSDYSAEELEERMLSDLGRAINIFPELREAMEAVYPTHVAISTDQAYAFLKEYSPLLEELGFVVALPAWWKQHDARVGLKLRIESGYAEAQQPSKFGFLAANQLLDYSWEISLGDKTLSPEEFRNLVATSAPLINIGDRWVELPPDKLRKTIEYLDEQRNNNRLRLLDALRLGLGIDNEPDMLPVIGLSADGWLQKLLEKDLHSLAPVEDLGGFTGELRAYQRDGVAWLAFLSAIGVGACLADDMGLGKTIQFLALLVYEKNRSEAGSGEHGPTLLIVPMSILANWEQEARRFAPSLEVYVHHGAERLSDAEFCERAARCDIVITTYSLVFRDERILAKIPWRRVALDEAQNIKNLETKQTKAVRRLSFARMEQSAEERVPFHRVALTGTPLENHLEELWSIFDYLNPGFLGSLKEFRTRYVLPIERFREKNSASALSRLISPFVLRRSKSDPKVIGDLPEKIEMQVITGLTEEQAALYQSVVDSMLPQVTAATGIHRKGLVLSTITKLKQICDHPALYLKDQSSLKGRSGKLERLEELLEVVLAEGDRVLLFTQYAQMGHLLKPYLQEVFNTEVLFLHGALSRKARETQIDKFRQPDGPKIFVLSLKAGGFGLNLTEANQVIHFDQWWNPAVEEQATDRAYRIGQNRNVQVRKFICQGTLEEKISALLEHKKDLAEKVVGTTKNMVTELSAERLRELLELSRPRTVEGGDAMRSSR